MGKGHFVLNTDGTYKVVKGISGGKKLFQPVEVAVSKPIKPTKPEVDVTELATKLATQMAEKILASLPTNTVIIQGNHEKETQRLPSESQEVNIDGSLVVSKISIEDLQESNQENQTIAKVNKTKDSSLKASRDKLSRLKKG